MFRLTLLLLATLPLPGGAAAGTEPNSLKIFVEQDRMYRVTGSEIAAAGLPLAKIDPSRLNLYHSGSIVPIVVDGLSPAGAFGAESAVLFWGEFPRGKETRADIFSKESAYTLVLDSADPPARYRSAGNAVDASAGTTPIRSRRRTLHLEKDEELFFFQSYDGPPTDRIMWKSFMAPPIEGHNLDLGTLPGLTPSAPPARIRAFFWGSSMFSHDWTLFLNDHVLGPAKWQGRKNLVFESAVGAQHFRPAGNVLRLKSGPTSVEAILLDWVEIDYEALLAPAGGFIEFELPKETGARTVELASGFTSSPVRVFDVGSGIELAVQTQPDAANKTYGAKFSYSTASDSIHVAAADPSGFAKPSRLILGYPSNLRGIAASPEYLLVSHRDFIEEARRLVELRRAQGLTAMLVDIEDVYDEYSQGRFSPDALKLFVDDLLARPAPDGKKLRYLFLVGGATYDYKSVKKGSRTWVPTHHDIAGAGSRDDAPVYSNDDYFTYGTGGQRVPLAAVGRLPCRRPEELRNLIDKIVEFEAPQPRDQADWIRRAVLIGAEGFTSMCDQVIKATPLQNWQLDKFYASVETRGSDSLQTTIINSINKGAGAVYFVGHGAFYRWRTGPVDYLKQTDLLAQDDMAKLTNRGRYPVVFASTCFSGMYDNATFFPDHKEAGIGVYLVEAEHKGAIAVIAPVGKSSVHAPHVFSTKVMESLYGGTSQRLGDAFLEAKKTYHSSTWANITLLGDPATFVGARYAGGSSSSNTKASP